MAAKVVMVAVPTVLGIASIRVYTVSEAPTDGLITREKLNIYTPLPQSAQFVPDRPGVIENGLTTAREGILPFVQAVKGACVSVKRGTLNLYHAGEDVFYYLKDPPPGFLPRFGTITMAGLLGMFLARKGSRFKRLAVPLSLMSVGASVCYPAQAVAAFKVTGRKMYAAGQWSSATVSSLLKSQEPLAKEAGTVPNPESAVVEEAPSAPYHASEPSSAQSAAISEADVESPASAPVSDEPIMAVITEEASVTLTKILPDQSPAETDPDQVPSETETIPVSEELPAPVQREGPSEDVSTEAGVSPPTSSLTPETEKTTPAEEEPAAPKSLGEPAVPAETEQVADKPLVASVEETLIPTHTPPPPEQSAAENSKGGSTFKADSALMDFGQSNPEDEDLYSTRS